MTILYSILILFLSVMCFISGLDDRKLYIQSDGKNIRALMFSIMWLSLSGIGLIIIIWIMEMI